jgi:hypothetical protein
MHAGAPMLHVMRRPLSVLDGRKRRKYVQEDQTGDRRCVGSYSWQLYTESWQGHVRIRNARPLCTKMAAWTALTRARRPRYDGPRKRWSKSSSRLRFWSTVATCPLEIERSTPSCMYSRIVLLISLYISLALHGVQSQ